MTTLLFGPSRMTGAKGCEQRTVIGEQVPNHDPGECVGARVHRFACDGEWAVVADPYAPPGVTEPRHLGLVAPVPAKALLLRSPGNEIPIIDAVAPSPLPARCRPMLEEPPSSCGTSTTARPSSRQRSASSDSPSAETEPNADMKWASPRTAIVLMLDRPPGGLPRGQIAGDHGVPRQARLALAAPARVRA